MTSPLLPDEELLTVGAAAMILGLASEVIRVLRSKGQLAALGPPPRGCRLFRRADVERIARERRSKR